MDRILVAFGFNAKVRKLFYQLVSTPTFVVLVNQAPSNFFKPSRGLHQGDPLSPIIFIIIAKGLGRIMHSNRSRGALVGLKSSSSPSVFTHQQIVDDIIMGGESSVREARFVKKNLNTYSKTSRQLINWDKSSMFFFNTPIRREKKIVDILGCKARSLPST